MIPHHLETDLMNTFMHINEEPKTTLILIQGYLLAKMQLSLGSSKLISQITTRIKNIVQYIEENIVSNENVLQLLVHSFIHTPLDTVEKIKVNTFCVNFDQGLNNLVEDNRYFRRKWENQINELYRQKQRERELAEMIRIQKEQRLREEQKAVECLICAEEIGAKDMAPLDCGSVFHRDCVYQHLQYKIDSGESPLFCPDGNCKQSISESDLFEYAGEFLVNKYEKLRFNKYIEGNMTSMSWCPTAGCTAVFQFDATLDNYRCPVCKFHYCLRCRCNYHTGMSCKEYQISTSYTDSDRKFDTFIQGSKFKQCPKCKFWVERSTGCSTMTCRCGQQFCYDCGGVTCPHGKCSRV